MLNEPAFVLLGRSNTGMSSQVSQAESLEEILQTVRNPVELLRNSQIGSYAFPVVRYEFTNWRDEQRSWRETCALFDQSHHMTDVYVEGSDALKVFSDLGINSFKNFKFNLVGRPPAGNWVQYNVETGRYNASAERDERSAANQGRRKSFRYQVQGPTRSGSWKK